MTSLVCHVDHGGELPALWFLVLTSPRAASGERPDHCDYACPMYAWNVGSGLEDAMHMRLCHVARRCPCNSTAWFVCLVTGSLQLVAACAARSNGDRHVAVLRLYK